MKSKLFKNILTATSAAALLTASTAMADDKKIIKDISVVEAQSMIATIPIVIDVRTAEEHAKGKIPNSLSIDFFGDSFESEIGKLDRNKIYIIHCQSGGRSSKALEKFKALGFTKVFHMKDGWAGWEKASK